MAEKTFNSRIVHKHDTEENWLKATSFTPKQGEIIIYDVDANYNYERIKIGDGVKNVNTLPFYAGSWEDLSDKPFWSEGPTVIEWPGDTTGLPMSSDGTTYKVSGSKPSQSEILGGKLTFKNGNVVEITSDIVENYGYIISIYYNTVFINISNGSAYNASLGVTLPEPGVYIQKNTYNQLLSFSYGEEVVYTLDEKYIPDTIARVDDIPAIDSKLSATSTNPVQNKVVNTAINNLSALIGDNSVSEQITDAVSDYLPLKGGKLTGNLSIDTGGVSSLAVYTPANSEGKQGYGRIYKNASATADYGLQLRDYKHGDTANSCAIVVSNNKSNVSDMLLFANQVDGGSNTYYKIYGEHNKPLPADIGAAASEHAHSEYINPIVTYYAANTNMSADDLVVPTALVVTNSELNAGLYNVTGGSFAYVFTLFYSSKTTTSRRMQIGMSYNSSAPRMAIRHYGSSGWTAWARLVTTAELNTAIQNVKTACLPKVTSITLSADYWVFSANAYYQDVPLNCVTATSKVDLQPTYYQLAEWQTDGLAFSTEAHKGAVRVWVTDVTPKEDITIQVTVQEVLEV